jgi:hypothetical protein
MATQLTSPIDAAIQNASNRLFQFLMARKDREIENRRMDIAARGVAVDEERVDIQRRADALETAIKVSSILPPGKSPAEYPAVIPIFREAFPDLSPEDFQAFAQIPWDRRTLQDALDEGAMELFDKLEEDDPRRERMVNLRAIGRAVTGTELSSEVSQAQLRGDQSILLREGLATIRNDPELARNAVLVGMGLEQEFEIPGIPGIRFPTSTAANIFAQLQMKRDEFGFLREQQDKELTAKSNQDLAAEIMKLGEQVEAPLGRAAAAQILQAYETSAEGNFEPGQSPLELLYDQSNPGQQRVIQAFIGSIDTAEDAWINSQPASVQNYFKLGRGLSEFVEKGEVPVIMEGLVRQGLVPELGFGWAAPGWGRGITFNFEQQNQPAPEGSTLNEQQMQLLGADAAAGVPEEELIAGAKQHGITLTPEIIRRARGMVQNSSRPQDPSILEAPAPSGVRSAPAAPPRGAPQAQLNMEDPVVRNLSIRATQMKAEVASIEERIQKAEEVLSKPGVRQSDELRKMFPGHNNPEGALRRQLVADRRRRDTVLRTVGALEKAAANRPAAARGR